MAPLPTEPLTKITLNIFTEDVDWLRRNYGVGWSTKVRAIINNYIKDVKTYAERDRRPDEQRSA